MTSMLFGISSKSAVMLASYDRIYWIVQFLYMQHDKPMQAKWWRASSESTPRIMRTDTSVQLTVVRTFSSRWSCRLSLSP